MQTMPGFEPVRQDGLRVALDINCIYTTQAGTARYTQGLLSGFRLLEKPAPSIIPLAWPVENFGYRQPVRALKTAYRELLWCRTGAYSAMKTSHCHLLHSTTHLDFRVPSGVGRVHTLYDLAVLRHPEKFRSWQRAAGRRFLRQLPAMDKIICISRFTAKEAMSLLSIPARKLEVVYCASDLAERHRESPSATIDAAPSLPSSFFLFVGSLEPGKNLALLKAVYAHSKAQGSPLPPLVIAGSRWLGVGDEGAPPDDWVFLGRVSDETLITLYRQATALVFPSKYEGFGLPVLEAMSLGCPVICSRSGSIPEVGGEAVLYVDLQAPSLGAAMQGLLDDDGRRAELVANGNARARLFSWRRCAAETAAVYESVRK